MVLAKMVQVVQVAQVVAQVVALVLHRAQEYRDKDFLVETLTA